MVYFLFSLVYLITQSFLIISLNINIYPEIFFFPWLISKNLIPYRDFFDVHGFLLYYLLFPFIANKTLFFIKLIYFLIQSANLILVLSILKKTSSKLGFLFFGFLYVILNFFITENNFWFENLIATFFLIIFYLLITDQSGLKTIIISLLTALVAFIKPTALVITLPLLYHYKQLKIVLYVFISWVLLSFVFLSKGNLPYFIQDVFSSNSKISFYFLHRTYFLNDVSYLKLSVIIFLIALVFFYISRRKKLGLFPLLFLVSSLIFLYPVYGKEHLSIVVPFFIIFLNYVYKNSHTAIRLVFIIILSFYSLYVVKITKNHYYYLQSKRPEYIKESAKNITSLKKYNLDRNKFFVYSNQAELYYFFDQLPPTKFSLIFPWYINANPNLENQVVNDLIKNKVKFIITSKKQDINFPKLNQVEKYIKINYSLIEENKKFIIYNNK